MSPQNAPDIRDIKPWVALSEWSFWLALAFLVALLLGAGFWWWRRRKPKANVIVAAGPTGPTAEARLRALEGYALADGRSIRHFHFELSECLRGVLETEFGFPATDRTTEELRSSLRGIVPDPGRVVALLETADLVKFTDYRPSREQCRDLLIHTLSVVEDWKPKAVESGTVGQTLGESNT